jgi:hypothetical protein
MAGLPVFPRWNARHSSGTKLPGWKRLTKDQARAIGKTSAAKGKE